MSIDSKRIEDIKYQAMIDNQGFYPSVHLSKSDFDYLVEVAELAERYEKALKTIEEMETVEKRFGRNICTATGIIAQKTLEG
jgi:hypothetical protein